MLTGAGGGAGVGELDFWCNRPHTPLRARHMHVSAPAQVNRNKNSSLSPKIWSQTKYSCVKARKSARHGELSTSLVHASGCLPKDNGSDICTSLIKGVTIIWKHKKTRSVHEMVQTRVSSTCCSFVCRSESALWNIIQTVFGLRCPRRRFCAVVIYFSRTRIKR